MSPINNGSKMGKSSKFLSCNKTKRKVACLWVKLGHLKVTGNLIWRLPLVASATPAGGSFTGASTGTVGFEGGVETSADTCWGGCMGGSSESFNAPSASCVDVTVIFEGGTSTSEVCVVGGRAVPKLLQFSQKVAPIFQKSCSKVAPKF